MSTEGVGVGELLVELDRTVEELQSGLVLLLETVAVAHNAPSLGNNKTLLECKVAEVC